MPNEQILNVRVPDELLKKLDRVARALKKDPGLYPWRVSRSSIMRLALMKGLEALEQQHTKEK